MRDAPAQPIQLEDYTPPAYLVSTVELEVDIIEGQATVRATLAFARNPARPQGQPLVLDGDGLETLSVAVDGRVLPAGEYAVHEGHLEVPSVPESFVLCTVVRFDP